MTRLQLKKPNKYLSFLTRSKLCSLTATSSKTLHAFSRGRRFRRIRGAAFHKFACAKKIHPPYDCRLYTYDTKICYEKGWLQVTRGAITKTCEELGPHFNNLNNQTISCFIDWNYLETHVVIHGAVESLTNVCRWNPLIVQAFYNDWKSMNGLKHQAVETLILEKYSGPLCTGHCIFAAALCSVAFSYWFLKFNYCV